jgi:hypothetical protein
MDDLRERSLTTDDGRVAAWTEYGDPAGRRSAHNPQNGPLSPTSRK